MRLCVHTNNFIQIVPERLAKDPMRVLDNQQQQLTTGSTTMLETYREA